MWGGGVSVKNSEGFKGNKVYSILGHTNWQGMDFVRIRDTKGFDTIKGAWSDFASVSDNDKLQAFRDYVKANEKAGKSQYDGLTYISIAMF